MWMNAYSIKDLLIDAALSGSRGNSRWSAVSQSGTACRHSMWRSTPRLAISGLVV